MKVSSAHHSNGIALRFRGACVGDRAACLDDTLRIALPFMSERPAIRVDDSVPKLHEHRLHERRVGRSKRLAG